MRGLFINPIACYRSIEYLWNIGAATLNFILLRHPSALRDVERDFVAFAQLNLGESVVLQTDAF